MTLLGEPVAFFGENARIIGIFEVEIMIAESNEDWRDGAELLEPGGETVEFRLSVDGIERIDEVAGDNCVIWLELAGLFSDGAKALTADAGTKVNVAD